MKYWFLLKYFLIKKYINLNKGKAFENSFKIAKNQDFSTWCYFKNLISPKPMKQWVKSNSNKKFNMIVSTSNTWRLSQLAEVQISLQQNTGLKIWWHWSLSYCLITIYKSFFKERNGHHLPKYLYMYITFRNVQIWSRAFKPLSTEM